MTTQDAVDRSCDTALLENGYSEMLDWTAEQLAIDLCDYNAHFEGVEWERLLPFVRSWLDRRRTEVGPSQVYTYCGDIDCEIASHQIPEQS